MRDLGLPLAALGAALFSVTGSAMAESPGYVTGGTVTLDYRSGHYRLGDYDSAGLSFQSRLAFGPGLEVAMSGRLAGYRDGDFDYWSTASGVAPSYRFGSGLSLGGYYQRMGLINDGEAVALTSYGLTLGYELSRLELNAFGGLSQETPAIEGTELRDLGVGAEVTLRPDTRLAGSLMQTDLSAPGLEAEVLSYVMGAQYADRSWSVYAGLGQTETDDILGYPLRVRSTGLGAAYDISDALKLPLSVSLELVRQEYETTGFDEKADEIRLGLSIPLGDERLPPAGSVAAGAFGSAFTGFHSEILSSF